MCRRKRIVNRNKQQAAIATGAETMQTALRWLIEEEIFQHLCLHGNTKWKPVQLIVLALTWVWSGKQTLTDAFADGHRWSIQLLGTAALSTYQGMAEALVTWTSRLMPLIRQRMHQQLKQIGRNHWRIGPWVAIAVDGSRVSLPRTQSNEAAYCAANYGHGQTAKYRKKKSKGMRRTKNQRAKPEPPKPQVWVTLLWHMGLGVPWSWRMGSSDSSERRHCREMLDGETFPENTLFCGDAGFVGYDFWKAIVDRGNHFLIRVGGNVRLLKNLGYAREREGLVYCWPDQAMRGKQPPLVMRMLTFHDGRKPIYVVTDVLSERALSHSLAGRLYQLRWGIEIAFRGFKQTFCRRKLRSRRADRVAVELEWSLVGLGIIQLLAVQEQLANEPSSLRVSVAEAIRATRACLESLTKRPPLSHDLLSRLRGAQIDTYQRSKPKAARYQRKCYDKPTAGKPRIINARRKHKRLLQQLRQNTAA